MGSPTHLRLAFDISELAAAHGRPGARRGINRVVENVLDGLRREPGIDLVFTATGALKSARRLHAADPVFAARPLLRSRYQEAAGWVNYRLKDYVSRTLAERALWRRGLRLGLTRVTGLINSQEARLPAAALADCDIFHSLYGPIPGTLRRLPRLRKFLTVYDLIPILDPSVRDGGFLRRALSSVQPEDWLLCISQSVKNDVCGYLKHDPARVIVTPLAASREIFYPCGDPARIDSVRTRYGIPAGTRYLLSLSALDTRKNLPHLIRCFLKLSSTGRIPDLCLVLVGQENPANIARLRSEFAAQSPGLPRVVLTGYVEDADLAALYSGATAFVFPSRAEGFGLPPLEAMQCGVPVISSNATSLPEVIGDVGLLVDPQDEDGLCAAILHLYGDNAQRADLAARGIARARQFTWEKCVGQTLLAYRTAMAHG